MSFIPTDFSVAYQDFPKRKESEFDTFGVGHSVTSISGSIGMAVASRYLNIEDKQQHCC
jgi:1-deoxy-D-xylulose-5-phosphate synthase